MKTLKLSLILFLLINSALSMYAFDYQTVYSYRNAFFDLKAIKIDSVKFEGNDSVFYPVKSIRQLDYNCYTPYGASFLGEKIIIKDNWNYFFNGRGDTIKIKTDAVLNESFELFHIPDSVYATATVISIDLQNFLGLSDSVKTIKIEIFDKDGNPIRPQNTTENPIIQISKNFGFLQTFNFYDFYFKSYYYSCGYCPASEKYSLLGLSNPKVGEQNLTWFEVFDFQPNDELHIVEEYIDFWSPYQRRIKIIEKYLSRTDYDNDSISYNVFKTVYRYNRDYAGQVTETTSSGTSTYTYKPNPEFDRLVGEPIISYDDYGGGFAYALYGSSTSKTVPNSAITYNEWDGCWGYYIIWDGCSPESTYYKGLGGSYYEPCYGLYGTSEKKLVYYKKGDETWGTPLTSINQIFDKGKNLIVNNPVGDNILLNNELIEYPSVFELIDLNGIILLQKTVNAENNTMNVNHIQDGLYIFRLIKNNEVIFTGKVIKQ